MSCWVLGTTYWVVQAAAGKDVLLSDRNRAFTVLTQLQTMGARIAIDDFRRGHSSLSHLRDLPVVELDRRLAGRSPSIPIEPHPAPPHGEETPATGVP